MRCIACSDFTLVVDAARVNVVYVSLFLTVCFSIFLYLHFCLYDETEHSALRRLYHSFMLFGGCPCSRWVAYRRSYCCVEQSETVVEEVVFRSQLLPVFVKRRPSFPDTIFDFGRFLTLACNQLT